MGRIWIVVGDTTTGGGSVVSGSPFTDIDGKPVARIGDSVVCLRHGPTVIVSGDSTMIIDGQPVARHGDGVACGCSLISVQQVHVHIDAGGGGGGKAAGAGGAAAAASKAAGSALSNALAADEGEEDGEFDLDFLVTEQGSGEPLVDWPYRIELASGREIEGRTDSEGKTAKLSSKEAETATLHVYMPDAEGELNPPPNHQVDWS
ncbi:PAAR domain-containing protein [Lysobacter capsici]|uniref:PAAR domain-containing protein n=1 Tax=Lysobacter capsici TaxID=435897 RepID=UPI000BBAC99C|nr:PAAR domain-containing protein [Lysobacter capsici]ATE70270.1 hypothetical protein CNO08_02125 [Lysobacter capsici]